MRKFTSVLALCLCGGLAATAQTTAGQTITFTPAERAVPLEAGKYYMIFNTAKDDWGDRWWFIYNNGSGQTVGVTKTKPSQMSTTNPAYLWTVEPQADDTYFIKSAQDGTYIDYQAKTGHTEGQTLYIQPVNSTKYRMGDALSMSETDETQFINVADNITGQETNVNNTFSISLTQTESDNGAWNGGTDAFTTWTSAHPYAFYEVTVSSDLAAAVSDAEAALAKEGVGYPTADAAAREALATALKTVKDAGDVATTDQLVALAIALQSFKTTSDIQMPEDGKAYAFINVHPAAGKHYLAHQDNALNAVAYEDGTTTLPVEATFVAHKLADGKYIFTSNAGLYLALKGNNNNVGTGYTAAYDATYSPIEFRKMAPQGNYTSAASDLADFFGMVALGAKRKDRNAVSEFILTKSGSGVSFNQDGSFTMRYANDHSSAFQVVEVSYPNVGTRNAADGISGIAAIGTFSAPFPTVVPQGVTANYVSGTSADGGTAQITAIAAGEAIPANQGVLLTSDTEAGAVTMVPATSETQAAITTNLLGNSAGAEKDVEEGSCILTKKNNEVAFYAVSANRAIAMNKAYLTPQGTAQAVKLSFGGATTGIGSAVTETATDTQAVYDLSGRRVTAPVKGGVYISGGKKFILK